MPNYTPPPPDLNALNPIQRYMQKGELEISDYATLLCVVLAYFVLRPRIEAFFAWMFGGEEGGLEKVKEGEKVMAEYQARREEKKKKTEGQGERVDVNGGVRNRRGRGKMEQEQSGEEKVPEEKLVDWDDYDEVQPRRPEAGDKADVLKWLDRWDAEVDKL